MAASKPRISAAVEATDRSRAFRRRHDETESPVEENQNGFV